KDILNKAYPKLGVEGLLTRILPENAELIVRAAELLNGIAPPEDLKRLYKEAGRIFDSRGDDLTAGEYFLKGRCAEQLGETDKALRAYKIAPDMNAIRTECRWRY